MANTIIKYWFLVNFQNEDNVIAQVLWGIVAEDINNRWAPSIFYAQAPLLKICIKGFTGQETVSICAKGKAKRSL